MPELKPESAISLRDWSRSGGRRELATSRLSMVTSEGAGAALGTISPIAGEHEDGPELQPIQLQET